MITKLSSRKKKQAALALAVSLWIATGGIASATDTVINENCDGDIWGDTGGDPNNNTITVNNAIVKGEAYGSSNYYGEANNNTITLNGAVVTRSVYGGDAASLATGNTVRLNGAAVGNVVFGGYAHGHEQSMVKGNTVTATNSKIAWRVIGGYARKGEAIGNTVTLQNSDVGTSGGGTPMIAGGCVGLIDNDDTPGKAVGNTVTLRDTTAGVDAFTNVYGGYVKNGDATGNTVRLINATVRGFVYGGYKDAGNGDVVTGNTLNLLGANTVSFGVHNFETINIRHARWGTPALTTPAITNTGGSQPNISAEGIIFTGASGLTSGQSTTLIPSIMANYPAAKITGTNYRAGTTMQGTGRTEVVGNDLIYTVETVEIQEQTHNVLMGAGAGMATLSAGNDFIGAATEGLGQAANVGSDGVSSYAQMGGGSIRQETGSHIDVKSWNAVLALGRKNEKPRGTFEYGAFFEYGRGNYTTHNGDLRGDGFTYYTGGGLLTKYTAKGGAYVEGSLRAGSVHGETKSVLLDENDEPYNCDVDAPYWGVHIGVGKEFALKNGDSVDVYGKYFLNRRNSTSFDFGGQYELDALTSKVLRVGARYTIKRGGKWNYYAGAAYEHEFDGKATGTADGFAIRGTDPSGGSVRMELGATMEPDTKSPWKLDLNVSGFAGKKRGMTGGVSVAFMF